MRNLLCCQYHYHTIHGDSLFERYRFPGQMSFRGWIFCAVRIAISNTWCRLARGKLFIVTLYFTHKLKLRTHFDELHYHNLTNWDQDWKLKLTKDTFDIVIIIITILSIFTHSHEPSWYISWSLWWWPAITFTYFSDSLGNDNIETVFAVTM